MIRVILQKRTKILQKMAIYYNGNHRMNSPNRAVNSPNLNRKKDITVVYLHFMSITKFSISGFLFSKGVNRQIISNSLNWDTNSLYFSNSLSIVNNSYLR